jgi:hypothetical protein
MARAPGTFTTISRRRAEEGHSQAAAKRPTWR